MKLALIALFTLVCFGITAFYAYKAGLFRFNYPLASNFSAEGVDVSHHQGEIEWDSIPKDRISFAYIKATEGGDWKDKSFLANWKGAKNVGLKVGAYHFFTLCRDGKTQARNFIDYVPKDEMLAPVIDLEYVGNCAARPSREDLLKELDAFVEEWSKVYKDRPVLYTTHHFYQDYLKGTRYQDYPLWIRDVFMEAKRETYPSMVIWQYADNARISGIKGPVDLNFSLK